MSPPLEDLRDIHLPDLPGFWPPAIGWWIVTTLALLVIWWIWRLLRRQWRVRRWRRYALAQLRQIERQQRRGRMSTIEAWQALSMLLRRLMLLHQSRHDVAALEGEAWLAALDRHLACGDLFRHGIGRELATLPYQSSAALPPTAPLIKALRRALRRLPMPTRDARC
jgi:hypothetical protein